MGPPVPYRLPVTRAEKRRELACDINRLKSLPPATMNAEIVARWRRQEIERLQSYLYTMGTHDGQLKAERA